MMKTMTFTHWQLLGAASAVLTTYAATRRALDANKDAVVDALSDLMDTEVREMLRLANNVIQLRNDWGDPVQLAGLIVFLIENHRSTDLDA